MSAPAELTHVTETVEIFEVDVGNISTAELLAQGRHSGPRAARPMIPGRKIFLFSSFLALIGAQGVTVSVCLNLHHYGSNLEEDFKLTSSRLEHSSSIQDTVKIRAWHLESHSWSPKHFVLFEVYVNREQVIEQFADELRRSLAAGIVARSG